MTIFFMQETLSSPINKSWWITKINVEGTTCSLWKKRRPNMREKSLSISLGDCPWPAQNIQAYKFWWSFLSTLINIKLIKPLNLKAQASHPWLPNKTLFFILELSSSVIIVFVYWIWMMKYLSLLLYIYSQYQGIKIRFARPHVYSDFMLFQFAKFISSHSYIVIFILHYMEAP